MRMLVSLLVIGLMCLAPAQAGDDAELKKEAEALAGKWNVLKIETGGGGKNESVEGAYLDFAKDGKAVALHRDGKTAQGKFTIDPAKKPRQITIRFEGFGNMVGIYKIEKNLLTICYAPPKSDSGRPKEFALTKDEKVHLMTLERAK